MKPSARIDPGYPACFIKSNIAGIKILTQVNDFILVMYTMILLNQH